MHVSDIVQTNRGQNIMVRKITKTLDVLKSHTIEILDCIDNVEIKESEYKIDNILPITISSILVGHQYKTFWSEIMSTLTMILCYIIALIIIKKITINKKRDIG